MQNSGGFQNNDGLQLSILVKGTPVYDLGGIDGTQTKVKSPDKRLGSGRVGV